MNVCKAWLYVADPRFMSEREGTDCNLTVDVGQEFVHWRWCQSPGIYWQFTIQFPSFIFWTARVIWLYTVITTPATHTHVLQMFPKRMNSREAPRSLVLDSTKSWKPTSWNHRTPCCFLLTDPSQTRAHIYDLSPQDVSGLWGVQGGWHPYRCI